MSISAVTMMLVGVVIIWGGLVASISIAVSKSKKAKS